MNQNNLVVISTASTEYVRVTVDFRSNGVVVDPTDLSVYMAFKLPDVTPADADFHNAIWQVQAGKFVACCLVGPTFVVLPAEFYNVWIKIEATPEIIVKLAGSITIE